MYEISNRVIGKVLRDLRTKTGLEQDDLADILSTSQSKISKLESGEQSLKVKEIFAYAEALGTTPEYILDEIRAGVHHRRRNS